MNNPIPSEPSLATLAERMGWLVEASGFSYRAVDRIADVTEGHARALAIGTFKEPKWATIRAYATVFGCTEAWLFEGEGEAPDPGAVLTRCKAAHERAEALKAASKRDPNDVADETTLDTSPEFVDARPSVAP